MTYYPTNLAPIGLKPCPTCGYYNCSGHNQPWPMPSLTVQSEIDYEKLADMVAERIVRKMAEKQE